jgi:muramoyltetrapeptide carboxypeptidase
MNAAPHRYAAPPRLRPGSTIGVLSSSAWAAERFPARTERALAALARAFDCRVRLLPAQRSAGGTAGTGAVRAAQLIELIKDPEIGAVLTVIGGNNANDMLEHLDEVAELPPKILVGFSDNTALLHGYQALTGSIAFYGPALLSQFGEWPEPFPSTVAGLRHAIADGRGGPLDWPGWWTEPGGDWAGGDEHERPRHSGGPCVLREGAASGTLFGGNVPTLDFLAGTRWWAPPRGPIVLCVEATADAGGTAAFRRSLTHLRQLGILERTTAVLVGRTPGRATDPDADAEFRSMLLEHLPPRLPIAVDLPFGHTDPLVTLPLGAPAEVRAVARQLSIDVVGPTVR